MQAEPPGTIVLRLGQGDFGVHVVAVVPGRPEPLESGTVLITVLGEAGVQAAGVQGFGPGRGPRPGQVLRRRLPGDERAGRVPGPLLVGGSVLLPCVQVERAPPGRVGHAHRELQGQSGAVGQDER